MLGPFLRTNYLGCSHLVFIVKLIHSTVEVFFIPNPLIYQLKS